MKKHEGKRGFTLVELLVVIAIISILAGMLLPALEQARNAAQTTDCLNSFKQIGMSMMFYKDEFDNYMIPPSMSGGFPNVPSGVYGNNAWSAYMNYNYFDKNKMMFKCQAMGPRDAGIAYWIERGYNAYLSNTSTYSWSYGRTVSAFSQVIMLGDSVYQKTAAEPRGYYAFGDYQRIDARHGNEDRTNLLYCDGHGQTVEYNYDPTSTSYDHVLHPSHFRRPKTTEAAAWPNY